MPDFDVTSDIYHDEVIEDTETSPLTDRPLIDSSKKPPAKDTMTRERVWIVAQCSLIASLSSMVGGMVPSFTSSALLELSNGNLTIPTQQLKSTSILFSMFGVSDYTIHYDCRHSIMPGKLSIVIQGATMWQSHN